MGKLKIVVFAAAMLILGGCSSISEASTASPKNHDAALTEVAKTVVAQLTPPPLTLTARFTPVPTIVFIVTPTPTQTSFPTPTSTLPPAAPLPVITVKSYSYCRVGPTEQNIVVSIIYQGDSFTPQGISPDGQWWYVAAPKLHRRVPADHCWIYKGITSIKGDVSGIPVIAPTALPTQPAGG
jgi:hypothetical protein